MYQNPMNSQCWPLILEKGLAKFYDGYRNLHQNINIEDLLKMLTGVPLILINTTELQKVKKILGLNYFTQSKEKRKGKVLCINKNNNNNNNEDLYFP